MKKTLIKSRYNPKYKFKSQNQPSKHNAFTNVPSNLQSFKQKLLTGNGFIVYI